MKKENQVLGLITNKNKALERERQLKHREQIIMNRTNHKERKKFQRKFTWWRKISTFIRLFFLFEQGIRGVP